MAMKVATEKKDFHPSSIMTQIHSVISQDSMQQNFYMNLFVFNLDANQLLFSNSLDTDAYYVDNTTQKISNININNQKLSKTNNPTFIETTLNFKVGDRAIFLTKKINPQKQDAIKSVILDNMLFSCRHQAEKIINEFKNFIIKNEKDPFMTICIQRKA